MVTRSDDGFLFAFVEGLGGPELVVLLLLLAPPAIVAYILAKKLG